MRMLRRVSRAGLYDELSHQVAGEKSPRRARIVSRLAGGPRSGSEEDEQDGHGSHHDPDYAERQHETLAGARLPVLRSAACNSR